LGEKLRFAHELSVPQILNLCKGHLILLNETKPVSVKSETKPSPVIFFQKENEIHQEESLIGTSSAIQTILSQIKKFAGIMSPILIEGEVGTGKELVSRLIHQQSPISNQPFFSINCISNSNLLIESQLFGHGKNTLPSNKNDRDGLFIQAKKGTVLLKEIDLGSTYLHNQILRLIEEGQICPLGSSSPKKIRARLIINSTVDLKDTLRKDLYFALNRIRIKLPPLRERKEDIPVLAEHFLKKYFNQFDMTLDNDLLEAMRIYPWPGNVQELEKEIKRMAMISKGSKVLRASLFQPQFSTQGPTASLSQTPRISSPTSPSSSQRLQEKMSQGGHFKHTLARRQALRELFYQHDKITPLRVVQHLKCSIKTASTDLHALEEEGFIRRILTSAHLRTSYYVQTDSPLVRQS